MGSRRSGSRLIFVVGGASSGKSDVALRLAVEGIAKTRPCAFVATAERLDEEMSMKIGRHRQSRSAVWETAEVPIELSAWFGGPGMDYRVIVVDCLTMWLSNLCGQGAKSSDIIDKTQLLVNAIRRTGARVVLVSNELGMGLVPADPQTREFRQLAGEVNQLVATAADDAYFVVSGIPLSLNGEGS